VSTTPTDPEGTAEHSPPNVRLRQLVRAAIAGQKVSLLSPAPERRTVVSGYVAGIDESSLFFLAPDDETHLVRQYLLERAPGQLFEIHAERTYNEEPLREKMHPLIHRFRAWVRANVFVEQQEA
jgi:hypothetical protein